MCASSDARAVAARRDALRDYVSEVAAAALVGRSGRAAVASALASAWASAAKAEDVVESFVDGEAPALFVRVSKGSSAAASVALSTREPYSSEAAAGLAVVKRRGAAPLAAGEPLASQLVVAMTTPVAAVGAEEADREALASSPVWSAPPSPTDALLPLHMQALEPLLHTVA
jgi:hypothetical protein